jgi:hypothetical protein
MLVYAGTLSVNAGHTVAPLHAQGFVSNAKWAETINTIVQVQISTKYQQVHE